MPFGRSKSTDLQIIQNLNASVTFFLSAPPTKGKVDTGLEGGAWGGGREKEHFVSTFRFDVRYVRQDPGGKDSASWGL